MPSIELRSACAVLFAAASFGFGAPAHAATSGNNGTHDPSRIIESDGKFYFCGTGGRCASSTDGLVWAQTGLSIRVPSWASTYMNVPGYDGSNQGVWAPDIVFYNNKYYIYYSFCGSPAAHAPCVIGLYTTPTLDSTSASFKLTDENKVVNNPPNTTGYQFSTIDPAPIVDQSGNLWSSWGSGYGKDTSKLQIYITRMDTTGLPLATDAGYMPPMTLGYGLETGGIEGSYVHYHAGYYYLFWNSGGCCSGITSSYTIHVARSATISGPYTGAKVWYGPTIGSIHGPGHMGVYSACGVERFTYHYYPDTGGSVLGENELSWGSDGWPVAGAVSTTPLKPCGNPGSGGTGSGGAGSGASGAGGSAGSVAQGGGALGGGSGLGGGGASSTLPGDSGGASNAGGSVSAQGGAGTGSTVPSAGTSATTGGGPSAAGSASSADSSTAAGCGCSVPGDSNRSGSGRALLVAAAVALASLRRKPS